MATIDFDETGWPIVVVRYPPEFDNKEWEAHVHGGFAKLLDRKEKFFLLSDATASAAPSAKQRSVASQFVEQRRADWRDWCGANAFVSASSVVRGVLTAIQWVSPSPFPQRTFSKIEEAQAWLCQMTDREPSQLDRPRPK